MTHVDSITVSTDLDDDNIEVAAHRRAGTGFEGLWDFKIELPTGPIFEEDSYDTDRLFTFNGGGKPAHLTFTELLQKLRELRQL